MIIKKFAFTRRTGRDKGPTGRTAPTRAEYDPSQQVFRLYQGDDLYCAMIVQYAGDVISFEIANDTELVVYGADGMAARFDAVGHPLAL